MKNIAIFLIAAVLVVPVRSAAQASGSAAGGGAASGSAQPATPQPAAKASAAAGTQPDGGSAVASGSQAATPRPARKWRTASTTPPPAAAANSEDLVSAGGTRIENLSIRAQVISALNALASLRSSLLIYYGDTEGVFPPDLQTLVPKYAKVIPEIAIAGTPATGSVTLVKKLNGNNVRKAVRNTGGWLYIADPKSPRWGDLVIDSVRIYKGKPLYEY